MFPTLPPVPDPDPPACVPLSLLFLLCVRAPCSKLNGTVATVVKGMEAYEFSVATSVSCGFPAVQLLQWLAC